MGTSLSRNHDPGTQLDHDPVVSSLNFSSLKPGHNTFIQIDYKSPFCESLPTRP